MTYEVLISCRQLQATLDRYMDRLTRLGINVTAPPVEQQLSEADLLPIIGRFDAIIAGDDFITARVIEAGTRLKVICKWGIGIDAIDVAAARDRGIPVYNTPGMFGEEVADVALGYVIMLARGLHLLHQSVCENGWRKIRGMTLAGKTIGVVGVGSIGRAIIRRAIAFGMRPVGMDVYPIDPSFLAETGTIQRPFPDGLAEVDFLVLACNLTAENRHLLNGETLTRLKPGAHIVNVSRGPLIDETALVEALQSGRVSGAGLDVFEVEPLPSDSPLRTFENVIFGTHNGSNTEEGVLRVNEAALANLFRGLGIKAD